MLDFNTLFPSYNIKAQKEKADMIIRSWKAEHEKEYSIFIERIDNISHGDLSILYDLFLLVEECIPSEEEYQTNPFSSKPITEFQDQIWAHLPLSIKSYIADFAKNNIEGYTKIEAMELMQELIADNQPM